MTAFNFFSDILPDPDFAIGIAGEHPAESGETAEYGAGFSSVRLGSVKPIMRARTQSGRMVTRAAAYHKWTVSITYNPMTRAEFDPIYTFLMEKQGGLKPFYVYLPQYTAPKNTLFASWALANDTMTVDTGTTPVAGNTTIMIESSDLPIDASYGDSGTPLPGDLFNVVDTNDATHTKTYMVTRVETADTYRSGFTAPAKAVKAQYRVHFTPGLKADIATGTTTIKFNQPKVHVFQTADVQEYSLKTNNLYSFSLKLEEAIL
jgi:hypothetical protein